MMRILLAAGLVWGSLALVSEPVAYVNGESIVREELDRAMRIEEILFSLSQQFPSFAQSLLLTEEGKDFLARYEWDTLEKLILHRIQLQEARARGLAIDEGEVERRTEETLAQIYLYYALSEEEFAAELLSQGTPWSVFGTTSPASTARASFSPPSKPR